MSTSTNSLQIPEAVVQTNISANGEAGRAWLEALPRIVEYLKARWRLTIGPAFEGGVVAFVAPAERTNGERAVLKVSFIDEETRTEGDALELWGGDGAVRLLDSDRDRGALLLERLEPGTSLADHPDRDEAISIGCALLRRMWRPVPVDHPFPLVRDLAHRWARELSERFDRLGAPFEPSLVQEASELCTKLAASTEPPILANRDFHPGNVLAARREPWLLIDPKPLAGERAFDTGHLLRTLLPARMDHTAVKTMVERLTGELGLSAEHIRQWGFVRSVEDALWGLDLGGTDARWDLSCARLLSTGA